MRIDCIVCFNFFHYGTVLARLAAVAGVSYKRRALLAGQPPALVLSGRPGAVAGCDASFAWRIHACVHSFFWNQFGDHI